MDERTLKAILCLLQDDDFARLLAATIDARVSWESFRTMAMPQGHSPEQMWEILCAMRKYANVSARSHQCGGPDDWFAITPLMLSMLTELEMICAKDSPLSLSVAEYTGKDFVIAPMVTEYAAAMRRDGVLIEYEGVREILIGERSPASDAEHLVLNAHLLSLELGDYVSDSVDRQLIEEFEGRIVRGVEELQPVDLHELPPLLEPLTVRDRDHSLAKIKRAFEMTDEYADLPPLIVTLLLSSSIWCRKLLRWHGLMEVLLRRLALLKNGYAALMYAPLSRDHLAWEEGLRRPPAVFSRYGQAVLLSEQGKDWTPYVFEALRLLHVGAREIDCVMRTFRTRDEVVGEVLAENSLINRRQQSTIMQAIRAPSAEVTITQYAREHGVVRATARRDLFQLVEWSLFRCAYRGRAIVFTPCADLEAAVRRHEPPLLFGANRLRDSNDKHAQELQSR